MFSIPKEYFHDRVILVLVCAKFFVAVLGIILILLRLGGTTTTYITQYRSNLGLDAFTSGSTSTFFVFIGALILISLLHLFLSIRMFANQRIFSVLALGLGLFLLTLIVIVSNALLQVVR